MSTNYQAMYPPQTCIMTKLNTEQELRKWYRTNYLMKVMVSDFNDLKMVMVSDLWGLGFSDNR